MNINILNAITNIVENPIDEIKEFYQSRNRANNMGEALEAFIKDAFANTIVASNEADRLQKHENAFSYFGNQNNPPDFMILGGDAVEVKKIENRNSSLALNSSYPKAKLFANSHMITDKCRNCEVWTEKDLIFAVGVVNELKLHSLYLVYGVDYAASADVYEKIKDVISKGVNTIPDIEFAETKELGRVNRVDPLGITYLRIRGMWGIENPIKTYKYIYEQKINSEFEFMSIINIDKYNSFPKEDIERLENLAGKYKNFKLIDIKIKIPDNPAKLKDAKLISFYR